MAMLSFGGIDVSKDRLDVMILPEEQCSSVPNNTAGWAKLVEQLRGSSIAAIGIEASGGYERGVMRALLAAGMSVRQVNPFKLRQFARASGVLAKSDPLDARMIASFVAIMPTRPAQRQAPTAERLAEMLAIRRQLSAEKVAAENCWKMRCCSVFLAAASQGSPPRSNCSTSAWPRSLRPTPRLSTATDCSSPWQASDRYWPAR
jgi:transposase